MEYCISKKEINRRTGAFTALTVSLPLSFALAGVIFWPDNLGIVGIFTLCLAFIFLLFRIFIVKFFHYFLQTKIILSDEYLERIVPKLKQKFLLNEIEKFTIVRTTARKIREIRIFTSRERLVLDGLENFDKFADELVKRCQKNIPVSVKKEPFDYDHFLFYPVLGCLVGIVSLFFLKEIAYINYVGAGLKILSYAVLGYVAIIGLFFVFGRPLSKRYGSRAYLSDLAWGLLMFVGAFIIFMLSK